MRPPEPSLEQWRALYASAKEFHDSEPWNLMGDAELVVVEAPGDGGTFYCSVMGRESISYGLAAYRGMPGLFTHLLVVDDALDDDEMLLMADCLSFHLDNPDLVDREDRKVHAALGLKFRGPHAWPQFRSLRPSLLPAYLSADEAESLTVCVQQVLAVAGELQGGDGLPALADDEYYTRRVGTDGRWETVISDLPPVMFALDQPDTGLLEAVLRTCPRDTATWELAMFPLGSVAGDADGGDGPDYWGRGLVPVDHRTGMILDLTPIPPEASVQDAFLDVIEAIGALPKAIRVTSGLLSMQLSPLAEVLGIKLQRVKRNRMMEPVAEHLRHMRRYGAP